MKNTKYVLYAHGGANNHGCEAIVRSTVDLLGLSKKNTVLISDDLSSDRQYYLDTIVNIKQMKMLKINSNSVKGLYHRIKCRLAGKYYGTFEEQFAYKKLYESKPKIALSIGGDNYCYDYDWVYANYNRILTSLGIKTVLWGCSIDEKSLERRKDDFSKYSLITARESLTYELLKKNGISTKIVLCPDPAFTLKREKVSCYESILCSKKVIGLNVSDFMKRYNSYPNATYNNFRNLIQYILDNTDYHIALIPHVRGQGNDDLVPIRELEKEFNNSRILVVDQDYNCMQLKDIIARCKMFVGCRTHSTIAAYSTCVPTLVVGYSIKAKGIAKDIFGDYEDLLVDAREFKTDNDLTKRFITFSKKENEIREYLKSFMPGYISRCNIMVEAMNRLVKE